MRDNWTETTLGQIAVFYNGKAYKQQQLLEEGKYRVLRVGNFFSNGNWYWSDLELDKNKYCDTGDLLYAWSASFGPRIWSEEKVIYHYHIWKIEENLLKVEKKFLYFWLEDDVQRMKRDAGTGSIMMHITKGDIEVRQINLPPIAEQKRIVDVVSSVDAYIDALQQHVAAARAARKAVLHELLSIGGNDWAETTLGELCEIYQPETISKAQMNDAAPYIVYGANGPVGHFSRFNHEEPEVVVTCRGATCGVVNMTPPNCWITGNAMVVRPRDERSTKGFLFWALQTSVDVSATISGSAQPQITRTGLAPSKIQVPPIAEQKRIVEIVSSIEDVIQATERAVVEAKNLRSGLLSDLLSGEHEIPVSYDELLGAA